MIPLIISDDFKSFKDLVQLSRAGVAELACLPSGRYTLKMYYVYILKSLKTFEFYKGITDNMDRRLKQHLSGFSLSTRKKLPLKLVHVEICDNRKEARNLEKYFKSGFGREIIKELDQSII